MPLAVRPRRSVLYMPGSNGRALEKAKTLPADGLIFDLEDAVPRMPKPAPGRWSVIWCAPVIMANANGLYVSMA